MENKIALSRYVDAKAVTKKLDALIKMPIHSISGEALQRYISEYFDKKCVKS